MTAAGDHSGVDVPAWVMMMIMMDAADVLMMTTINDADDDG